MIDHSPSVLHLVILIKGPRQNNVSGNLNISKIAIFCLGYINLKCKLALLLSFPKCFQFPSERFLS